jgi:hypothetical protein
MTKIHEANGRRLEALAPIATIIAAGVAVRVLLLLVVDPAAELISGDSVYYVDEAHRLFAGQFPSPYRPPLYPLFVALTARPALTLVAQCALTIGSGLAAFATFKGRIGYWTGLLIAGCPFFALFDFRLLAESLYINLAWLSWLLLYRNKALGSGLLLGLSILARDTLFLLPLFGLLFIHTKRMAWVALIAYVLALPWTFYGQGRMGLNLWIGTWERTPAWYARGLEHPDFPPYAFHTPAEEQLVRSHWLDDAVLKKAAIERMKEDPAGTLKAWAIRYPRLWIGTRSDQIPFRWTGAFRTITKLGFFGLNLLLLGFGLWGAWKPERIFLAPVLYTALIYIPFHSAETRYSLVALPFLIFLGVHRLHHRHS